MTATQYSLRSTASGFQVLANGQPVRDCDNLTTAFDTFVDLLAGKDLFDSGVRS